MGIRGLKKWALLLTFWVALQTRWARADQTITGNLTVTGNSNVNGSATVNGNTLELGNWTSGGTTYPGFYLGYSDGTTSASEFDAMRSGNIWRWQQNGYATLKLQMTLDNSDILTIYNTSGTAGIALNPSSTGTSTLAGSLTVNGTNNEMPNQTLVNANSVLTEGLGDSRYAPSSLSSEISVGSAPSPWGGTAPNLSLNGGTASGPYSFAEGFGSTASGYWSTAIGNTSTASGYGATAMGGWSTSSGRYSTAMGGSNAGGPWSTAMGSSTASGNYSTAMGASTAYGYGSTAMGRNSTASGYYSTAMGGNSMASGNYSTAMGWSTASGYGSTAMGRNSTASGQDSTALGYSTASGSSSTAMGRSSASGNYSTAMGASTASGYVSTAMGSSTASGGSSTAMGGDTTASGHYSTAMGCTTTAPAYAELALGRFNVGATASGGATSWIATDPLLEIGNGTNISQKSDALLLDKSGNLTVKTVTVTAPAGDIPMYTGN